MKNHHEYSKVSLGGSDIAMLIIQSVSNDGMKLEALNFGGDGEYSAYVVDSECEIPESYTKEISHDGRGWVKIYDDDEATWASRFDNGFRIFTRGSFGCIVQLI